MAKIYPPVPELNLPERHCSALEGPCCRSCHYWNDLQGEVKDNTILIFCCKKAGVMLGSKRKPRTYPNEKPKRLTSRKEEQLVAYAKQHPHQSYHSIGQQYGISSERVSSICLKYGYTRRAWVDTDGTVRTGGDGAHDRMREPKVQPPVHERTQAIFHRSLLLY